MSAPQALIDSEGWQAQTAKANRTVHDLARRVTKIKQLHVQSPTIAPGLCRVCMQEWPCPTWKLADGED